VTILPIDPAGNATPEALGAFLLQCREAARQAGRARLVSISLLADPLDPLAVLESIFEPGEKHCYLERPSEDLAVAGADAVVGATASGPGRFEEMQTFIDETLHYALGVGAVGEVLGGPLFFTTFSFADTAEPTEPFAPAHCFVPRWQVGRTEGKTIVTANLLVTPDAQVNAMAERVWRARRKFASFDYAEPSPGLRVRQNFHVEERGGEGHYEESVSRALSLIGEGAFDKIVLARAQDLSSEEVFHPLQALNSLRERFPECFAFSVANGLGQSFIGASPERLLCVRRGRLLTEALAGSIRRGLSASEDAALGANLLRSEKDLREQRTVLDSILRRLAPLGIVPEFPEQPVLRKLANVQHLHTPVEAELPTGIRLLDVLKSLHPTPAVGGSPRDKALPYIRPLEGFSRGLYAGALGWINADGEGEFHVGLRSGLIDGRNTRLYAGAGIVAGSTPDREFAETDLKLRALREAL